MNTTITKGKANRLALRAESAADLMTKNPVSLQADATILDAATFLIEKEISAAPVIDAAGRPVGVLSHTDLVRHDIDTAGKCGSTAGYYGMADLYGPPSVLDLMQARQQAHALVKDIMTPTVLSVSPDDSALVVVAELLALKVHRLFVIDSAGILVGVISTFDVLRKLRK